MQPVHINRKVDFQKIVETLQAQGINAQLIKRPGV